MVEYAKSAMHEKYGAVEATLMGKIRRSEKTSFFWVSTLLN